MKNSLHRSLAAFALALASPFLSALIADGATSTWQQDPINNDWNRNANWDPARVPNGAFAVASFATSNQTHVVVRNSIVLESIVFQPGASAYTISSSSPFATVLINGTGVVNNSGIAQTFVIGVRGHDQGALDFSASSSAGDAIYYELGPAVTNSFGGTISFFNDTTADQATFFANGATAGNSSGGGVLFFDNATAADASFSIGGGTAHNATGGHIEFSGTSTASRATLSAQGGTNSGAGGTVFFLDDSTGDQAKVVLSGNGTLDLSLHNPPGVTIGSLRGNGQVLLGSSRLGIAGSSDASFAGVIFGSGGLVKGGSGSLELSGPNTYAAGTVINAGTLLANNTTKSATGSGPVQVASGALGGAGTIQGSVTVGSGVAGNGAFLVPGESVSQPGTLSIGSTLTFNSDGFLNVGLDRNLVAGKVIAAGVTIQAGAQFAWFNPGGVAVPVGTVFTLIDNTAATPIAGTFDNLPDGLVFTDQGNTFEVSYEGGDSNDLTLTSIP